jgi:hypothetical protein
MRVVLKVPGYSNAARGKRKEAAGPAEPSHPP